MMFQEGSYRYAETNDLQALEMPYEGKRRSITRMMMKKEKRHGRSKNRKS